MKSNFKRAADWLASNEAKLLDGKPDGWESPDLSKFV